jgi:hypothetical protein
MAADLIFCPKCHLEIHRGDDVEFITVADGTLQIPQHQGDCP